MPGVCISITRSVPKLPPKTMVPLGRVWSPSKARLAATPVRLAVPFRVTVSKRRAAVEAASRRSPLKTTPSRRLFELARTVNCAPPVRSTVPPTISPPCMRQEPAGPSRARVEPVLAREPLSWIVPFAFAKLAPGATVKAPARTTVPPSAATGPASE